MERNFDEQWKQADEAAQAAVEGCAKAPALVEELRGIAPKLKTILGPFSKTTEAANLIARAEAMGRNLEQPKFPDAEPVLTATRKRADEFELALRKLKHSRTPRTLAPS